MEFLEEASPPSSIAPPGWTRTPGLVVAPSLASPSLGAPSLAAESLTAPALDCLQQPAEAALRWRLRAASFDYVIVYLAFIALCLLFHWRVATVGHAVLLTVMVAAYHFVLESRAGQTIGKARYGLMVVAVDGSRATPKAVAIRSALRVIDQLPVCYVSGLVSMVRTGPSRRQRIGDVVAETKVIAVGGVAANRGTPSWMLPAATLVAVIVSALSLYGIAEAGKQPLSSDQQAQFVAGCNNSALAASTDCQCFLSQLEADGYVTLNNLRDMAAQSRLEAVTGQRGKAQSDLIAAELACRH